MMEANAMKVRHTLRWRLMLLISVSVTALWLALAPWLLQGVRVEVKKSLDDRLAASARMVASLLRRQQLMASGAGPERSSRIPAKPAPIAMPAFPATLACKVSSLRGEVVALSQGAPTEVLERAPEGYVDREVDGERWRVYTLSVDSLRITTADRLSVRESLMSSVVLAAALPFGVALLGTLVLVWFGIRHGFRPLQRLSHSVAGRDLQDLQPLTWNGSPEEVKPLVDAINHLFLRAQQGLQRERQFTGDAAHELRTPLTGIKTQLQVARLTAGERSQHALDQAERAVDRMHATLEQLLLLARLDGNDAFADAPTTTAEDVSLMALTDVSAKAARKGVRIQYQATYTDTIAAPAALVFTALRNLLDNAIKFSPPGGTVDLAVSVEQDKVLWTVCDQGPGAPNDQIHDLVRRFVRVGGNGGSGLGLAIVDAICSRFGGALELKNKPPQGLIAQMRIPIHPAHGKVS